MLLREGTVKEMMTESESGCLSEFVICLWYARSPCHHRCWNGNGNLVVPLLDWRRTWALLKTNLYEK